MGGNSGVFYPLTVSNDRLVPNVGAQIGWRTIGLDNSRNEPVGNENVDRHYSERFYRRIG